MKKILKMVVSQNLAQQKSEGLFAIVCMLFVVGLHGESFPFPPGHPMQYEVGCCW